MLFDVAHVLFSNAESAFLTFLRFATWMGTVCSVEVSLISTRFYPATKKWMMKRGKWF